MALEAPQVPVKDERERQREIEWKKNTAKKKEKESWSDEIMQSWKPAVSLANSWEDFMQCAYALQAELNHNQPLV